VQNSGNRKATAVIRKKNRRKLRNLIVNKKQLVTVVIGSIYLFIISMVIVIVIISPLYHHIFQASDLAAQRDYARVFIILSEKLVTAVSLIFIFTCIPLIGVTHRFFGPLINFSNIFRKISKGDLTARVYLRRGDLLKSEAHLANEMIDSISTAVAEVKAQNNLLVAKIKEMVDDERDQSGLKEDLAELQRQALVCRDLLSDFKTSQSPELDQ